MATVTTRKVTDGSWFWAGTAGSAVNPDRMLAGWEVLRDGEVVATLAHRTLRDGKSGRRIVSGWLEDAQVPFLRRLAVAFYSQDDAAIDALREGRGSIAYRPTPTFYRTPA